VGEGVSDVDGQPKELGFFSSVGVGVARNERERDCPVVMREREMDGDER